MKTKLGVKFSEVLISASQTRVTQALEITDALGSDLRAIDLQLVVDSVAGTRGH